MALELLTRPAAPSVSPEDLATLRSLAEKAAETIIRLRCENPLAPRTRDQAFRFIEERIERMAPLCDPSADRPSGWIDSDDPFAEDALAVLRAEFAELQGGAYPIPLPEGCVLLPEANFDPFEHGRLYNWKAL